MIGAIVLIAALMSFAEPRQPAEWGGVVVSVRATPAEVVLGGGVWFDAMIANHSGRPDTFIVYGCMFGYRLRSSTGGLFNIMRACPDLSPGPFVLRPGETRSETFSFDTGESWYLAENQHLRPGKYQVEATVGSPEKYYVGGGALLTIK